jgi:hypothetical protein
LLAKRDGKREVNSQQTGQARRGTHAGKRRQINREVSRYGHGPHGVSLT